MDYFKDSNLNISGEKVKKYFSGPKIIFAILGVVILIEVIYALKVLIAPTVTSPASRSTPQNTATPSEGKISLSVPKLQFTKNEAVPVKILVDSGGRSLDGVDVLVRFDPELLEASSSSITRGEMFEEYPLMNVDIKKGLVSISGISSLGKSFKGPQANLAVINFKAKKEGKAALTIDFQKGSTADSNLVETGSAKDILETVNNLELTVQ